MTSGFVSLGISAIGLVIVLLGLMGLLVPERIVERQQERGAAMTNYEEVDTAEQVFVTRVSGAVFVLAGIWLIAGTPGI